MGQEKPEPGDGLAPVRFGETRQRRSDGHDEAFRRRRIIWLAAELVLAAIVFGLILATAGCVIVQSVPDARGRAADADAPVARVILEQRQAAPYLPPK